MRIAAGGGQFVAVGDEGTILTSIDGHAWTPQKSGTAKTLNNVAFGAGTFVAVGAEGTVLTSTDGINWQARKSGVTRLLKGVTFAHHAFWIVGWNGAILESGSLSGESEPDSRVVMVKVKVG